MVENVLTSQLATEQEKLILDPTARDVPAKSRNAAFPGSATIEKDTDLIELCNTLEVWER